MESKCNVEHGYFAPVVFSSFGGCGKERSCFMPKLVENISSKFDVKRIIVGSSIRSKEIF